MGFIELNYSGYGLYIMVKQYSYSAITIPFRLMVYTTHKNCEFGNGLWLCFNHSGIIVEKVGSQQQWDYHMVEFYEPNAISIIRNENPGRPCSVSMAIVTNWCRMACFKMMVEVFDRSGDFSITWSFFCLLVGLYIRMKHMVDMIISK